VAAVLLECLRFGLDVIGSGKENGFRNITVEIIC
jgi:hypothetical protein